MALKWQKLTCFMNRPAFVSMTHTYSLNPSASNLVELRDIRFGYGERVILDGISLTIPRGKVHTVHTSNRYGLDEHLKFLITRILNVIPQNLIFLSNFS